MATMPSKKIYEIDGNVFFTLEEFYEEISRKVIPDVHWGHNLDAFHDILGGGFGTPEEGFVLRWNNSELSKKRLGYEETVRQLEIRLEQCHPLSRKAVATQLDRAKKRIGPTVFDWLVEIIEFDVELELR